MTPEWSDLIIVCCHAIWLGGQSLGANEAEWLMAPFQRDEAPTFIEHLKAGLSLFRDKPNSWLVLSGYGLLQAYGMARALADEPRQRTHEARDGSL
jgi:hypothetical protein